MWYLEAKYLGDYGFGRMTRELLKIEDVFDYYTGNAEDISRYSQMGKKEVYRLYQYRACDKSGETNVFHFLGNDIPGYCKQGVAIVTIHDVIPLKYPVYNDSKQEEYKKQIAWTVHRADYILTISEASKKDIIDYFGIEGSKIKVIYNPVNPYLCKLDGNCVSGFIDTNEKVRGKRIVLTMANQYKYKNLNKTLEAFSKLAYKDVVLVVLGDLKNMKEEYVELANQWNISDKIVFSDHISDEELRLWYNAADVFVFPSLIEGFGLPPLEAMACGTPVVTSNTTSIPEVVGDAAIKINPSDAEEIADAIKTLLEDRKYSQKMASAGLERVKLFSESNYLENMKRFYREIKQDIKQNKIKNKNYSAYHFIGGYNYEQKLMWQMRSEVCMHWLSLKENNRKVSSWFEKYDYHKVAIYGMADMAELLLKELADSDIEICYGIDQSKRGNVYGIEVYDPDVIADLAQADVYVVMLPHLFWDIEKMLRTKLKNDADVVSIDEVIFEL